MRRTKIVATMGPASSDPAIIARMIRAGMDVARLNFSHGTHAEHRRVIERIRAASRKAGKPVGLLLDLQGHGCGSASSRRGAWRWSAAPRFW